MLLPFAVTLSSGDGLCLEVHGEPFKCLNVGPADSVCPSESMLEPFPSNTVSPRAERCCPKLCSGAVCLNGLAMQRCPQAFSGLLLCGKIGLTLKHNGFPSLPGAEGSLVSEAPLSWVDWVKGAEGRGCPVGAGISSSGNKVLAPPQVATEIWLQPCPAGGKGRLGSCKACDASGNQFAPKPQPSGTGPWSPFLTPQRALTTTPNFASFWRTLQTKDA